MESEKILLKRLKELEQTQNYTEMINELKKYESIATQAYSQLRSVMENANILGILKALEEISVTSTSLLRHCSDLLDQEVASSSLVEESNVSSIIIPSQEKIKEYEVIRSNTFTIGELKEIVSNFTASETFDSDVKLSLKFWYIKGGQNEVIELNVSEKEFFGKVLIDVLEEIKVDSREKFSISPLGFEALLHHQFQNSISLISKTYGTEFTLIKLFTR